MLALTLALALAQQPAGQDPARTYWQQEVSYRITASLDEPRGTLGGSQRLIYRNRSPDTLRTFALHLYLNAFRPGSRWAAADSAERRRRFNDLRDPDFAFNRIDNVRIMGEPVRPVWPFAPDSTIARFPLPRPLAPGDSMEVVLDWAARPSTLPRRQGRRGRHFDFAQWYPRVVAYDKHGWQEHPLYPAGEFYGEFGDFTVLLDVPEDQVVGATGVPVCGDPGWARAAAGPPRAPVDTARARTPEGVIRRLDVVPDTGARDSAGRVIRRLDAIPDTSARDTIAGRVIRRLDVIPDPAARDTAERPIRRLDVIPREPYYRRDFYGETAADLDAAEWCGPAPAPGRKRMVWRAKDVHHFAMSMSPDYRYEGGRFRDIAVHVLYQPGDEPTWGGGIAVERTVAALAWLDGLFGAYPWPQITNVHRIEGGGTEFPMMVHDGSAGFGLIVHEVGHNYLMGILANNEWREGFLDEGFTSWQTGLLGSLASDDQEDFLALDSAMRISDLDGWSEPTSLVSERYRDFNTYGRMIYDRGALFFYHLHRIVGDTAMSRILRTYYDRWKLKHVDEDAFRTVAEEVSGRDLSTFFRQWLHEVTLYNYAVGRVRLTRRPDAGWETRVEVVRKEPGVFPVEIVVRSEEDSARAVSAGVAEREWVTVSTRGRPREVVLNPRKDTPDWDALDDRKTRGFFGWGVAPRTDWYLDTQFSRRSRRDRRTVGLAPTVWYNDHGGVIVGARARTDYLGRFEQNTTQVMAATERVSVGWEARVRNPRWAYLPRMTQTLDAHDAVESRSGVALSLEVDRTRHRTFGPRTFLGGSVRWMETVDTGYLDLTRWEDGGFVEGTVWLRSTEQRGRWNLGGRLDLGGGLEYRTPAAGGEQAYLRITAEASARRALGTRSSVAFRTFGGWIESGERTLQQRRLFLSGADPMAEFRNPFLRSRGSLLAGHDVHYHLPGGGNVRGLLPGLTASRLASLSVEVDRRVFSRGASGLLSEVRIAGFADGALADGDIRLGGGSTFAGDAGIGLRAHHRIGDTRFVTRFDVPLLMSRPALAVHEQSERFRFRYVVSFEPAF